MVYVDSSALIRILLNEPEAQVDLSLCTKAYSSRLLRTECQRTFYRLLLENRISDEIFTTLYQRLQFILKGFSIVPIGELIMRRAERSFSTILGTLDAIHLATALELRDRQSTALDMEFYTHDNQLAKGARAEGFIVIGTFPST